MNMLRCDVSLREEAAYLMEIHSRSSNSLSGVWHAGGVLQVLPDYLE